MRLIAEAVVMHDSLDKDQIPLLDDLIVPGDATKRTEDGLEDIESNDKIGSRSGSPAHLETSANESRKTAFEATIEAIVTEILNRHMYEARKEITRTVLAEIRSRLTTREKKT